MALRENKFITLLDLSRQSKIITGETACFDGKIQVGVPFSGYPTGVDTGSTISLGFVQNISGETAIETTVFSGDSGTTTFDVSNSASTNYNSLFSGYSGTVWTNVLYSGNTSGLTLPINPLSADTQIVGPIWTLTQTATTSNGEHIIALSYTGYSLTYSFSDIGDLGFSGSNIPISGFCAASQENFSAGTLDYKGPLDYISTKEDATVEGILTTKKLTITNGASSATTGYVLTQLDSYGRAGWVFNSASASTNTFVSGGTYNELGASIDFSGNSIETTFSVSLSGIGATFGNTYFVTPDGSDVTGQRGNIARPFQTISGARDTVVSDISASTVTGTTLVYVFPGDYVGDELQYDGGNFYFEPGTVVTSIPRLNSGLPGTTAMFVVGDVPKYISSSYSANTCNVFGSGEFFLPESIDNDWNGRIIGVHSSGSGYFECYKFNVEQGVGIGVYDNGQATFSGKFLTVGDGYVATVRDYGDAVFNFNRISCDSGQPFFIRYGSSGGFYGKCVVNSEEISVGPLGSDEAVMIQRLRDGAEVIINSDKITSAASHAIRTVQCSGGDVTVNGKLFGARGVYGQSNTGSNLYVNGDMEITDGGIDMASTNSDNFTVIYDGNINVLSGATDGIDLDGGTLKLHGSLTNKDISGTGTTYNGIDKSGGILEIDSFSVFTDNESIVGSGNVTINRSLYIDKPINGSIITSGQYIFTGTTNVGDLVIYNLPSESLLGTDANGKIIAGTGGGGGGIVTGLTTTGTSGPSTLVSGTLNVPEYAGGGGTDVTTAATTTIDFSGLTYHYDSVTPATGNITENLTGAKLGLIQKIYHNDASEPTYPVGWVLMGDAIYFTSTLNIIYAEWAGGSRVEYWYVQEQ